MYLCDTVSVLVIEVATKVNTVAWVHAWSIADTSDFKDNKKVIKR